jgi:hypothetical protein
VRFTAPLKPAIDSTVITDVACCPGAEAVADAPNKEKSGVGVSPAKAFARLVTSTVPSPVTWSYPTPALKPYWKGAAAGQPFELWVQGTMLLPVVMS